MPLETFQSECNQVSAYCKIPPDEDLLCSCIFSNFALRCFLCILTNRNKSKYHYYICCNEVVYFCLWKKDIGIDP